MAYGSPVDEARRNDYDETIERPHDGTFVPPPGFEESRFPMSLPLGASAVYRDDRPTDSVQIRVYENRVTYQLDRYNPTYYPIRHAVFDAPQYTALAVAIGAGLAGGAGG